MGGTSGQGAGMTTDESPRKKPTALMPVHWWESGEDHAGIDVLREAVLGDDHPHLGRGFLDWMLGDANPAGRGGAVFLERNGVTVAFGGLCPRMARVQGKDVPVCFGFDLMVDRTMAGPNSGRYALRLSKRWEELATQRGYAFGVNFPNDNARPLLVSRHLGWTIAWSPRLMVRPLVGQGKAASTTFSARRLALHAGLSLTGAALDLRTALRARGGQAGDIRPLDLTRADDVALVDELWERRRDDTVVTLRRDGPTLRWRYAQHPARTYEILGLISKGRLAALVVTSLRNLEGIASVVVADCLLDPEEPNDSLRLITASLRRAARSGARIAATEALTGSILERALLQAGFFHIPRRFEPKAFTLCLTPLNDTAEDFRSADAWNFAWGDLDVV